MNRLALELGMYCHHHPRTAQQMIDSVDYGLRHYGFSADREYWRTKLMDDDTFLSNLPSVADYYVIMEAYDEKQNN